MAAGRQSNPTVSALILIMGLGVVVFPAAGECTTALVSGEAARDQRPLLWKNRDSGTRNNEAAYFRKGAFEVLGIINADDTTQIWAGVNNFGFAIMNAEARDMAVKGEKTEYDDEGYLMKTALLQCRSREDFEALLEKTNRTGRRITSNFGVLDARGGAAFFEVGNHAFYTFDGSGPDREQVIMVRANFAFHGNGEGYGQERYQRALDLLREGQTGSKLDHAYLITRVTRDIHPLQSGSGISNRQYCETTRTVNRYRTVACAVFHGVRPGEDPRLTTFWCTLGEPAVAVSLPLWVPAGQVPPEMNFTGTAPLNRVFQELKEIAYQDTTAAQKLYGRRLREIQSQTGRLQRRIFRLTERRLRAWRVHFPGREEMSCFQATLAQEAYQELVRIRHLVSNPEGR